MLRGCSSATSHPRSAKRPSASHTNAGAPAPRSGETTRTDEGTAPDRIAALPDLQADQRVCARTLRFVLDDKPVVLATSYLPVDLVAGSAITREDTGPAGTYARLAELGHAPAHFREDLRARMPQPEETDALELPSSGTPVVDIVSTA